MQTKLSEWGNSLGVRIPKRIIKSLEWKRGEQLEIFLVDESIHIRKKIDPFAPPKSKNPSVFSIGYMRGLYD